MNVICMHYGNAGMQKKVSKIAGNFESYGGWDSDSLIIGKVLLFYVAGNLEQEYYQITNHGKKVMTDDAFYIEDTNNLLLLFKKANSSSIVCITETGPQRVKMESLELAGMVPQVTQTRERSMPQRQTECVQN